jgi:hypothetical protein
MFVPKLIAGLFAGQRWCISETLETRFLATT